MSVCQVTGQSPCKCKKSGSKHIIDYDDFKTALRRLFTDHAVYTSLLVTSSVPVLQPDADPIKNRLLENPGDIARLLSPLIGQENMKLVEKVITDHLVLAAGTLEPVRNGDKQATDEAVAAFLQQANDFGSALSALNPRKLSQQDAIAMVLKHDNYVVTLVTLRESGKYEEYINTYDEYFNHMMMFSDTVAQELI